MMGNRKLHFANALLPTGWAENVEVTFDGDGLVGAVTADTPAPDGAPISGFAIPGLPNVHSHAHQRAMAGLAERAGPGSDSFWTWREAMYAFAARMTPQDLKAIAAQLYVEMLKGGYTAVGEFQYLHHQPNGVAYGHRAEMSLGCLAAAEDTGIAITMLPVLYAYSDFGGAPPLERQARFINDADGMADILNQVATATAKLPAANFGLAPHSLRAVTVPLLSDVITELDRINPAAPIHIHIAEQVLEVEACLATNGQRPVEMLLDQIVVNDRWCAIHATHISPNESKGLASSGAVAGLCPTTEANLGDGIFPAPGFIGAGGAISIGSDSHITVDASDELRILEYSQRLRDGGRNILACGPDQSTGRTLLDRVLAGGAQALGQPVGALEVGRRADIVVLDDDHPALAGRQGDGALDSWIFSGGRSCVRDVYVGGQHVIESGRHRDEDAILQTFRSTLDRLVTEADIT